MSHSAIVLVVVIMMVVGCDQPHHRLGVCVTGEINISGARPGMCVEPREIDALMDEAVQMSGGNRFMMTPRDPTGKPEVVVTCREYFAHKATGFFALTSFDMSMESRFERACGTLELLQSALVAQRSYLDEPSSGLGDVNRLPASILPTLGETASSPPTSTIGELVAKGTVVITSAERTKLDLVYGGEREARYEEVARGDFDHDGIEDMLVFIGTRAVGGTLVGSGHVILTRKAKDRAFEVVAEKSGAR